MSKLTVTTSWDDGHVQDLRIADLLKKYGLTATFYISPKCREIKSRNRLDDQSMRLLSRSFEVGAHTMTHPRLTKVPLSEAEKEIRHSKDYLEKVLGKKVQTFCYPGGYYNKKHLEIVKDAGFKYARTVRRLTTKPAKNNFASSTTVHAYKHYQDIPKILLLAKLNPAKFWKIFNSWEIDNRGDWKRLEKVLSHISGHHDANYVTNRELTNVE
jgi:peptidoglycan/xylan/chitin deacetylase (PgdA/CDA1 family)